MMKQHLISIFFILILPCLPLYAQKDLNFDENIRRLIEGNISNNEDSVHNGSEIKNTNLTLPETDNKNTTDLQIQQKESSKYNHSQKDTVASDKRRMTQRQRRRNTLQLSEEALYWSRYASDSYNQFPPYYIYKDTIIINPLFMPALFKKDHVITKDSISFYQPFSIADEIWNKPYYDPVNIFEKETIKLQIEESAYRYLRHEKPYIFNYTAESLPEEKINYLRQRKKSERYISVKKKEPSPDLLPPPAKFIPDRQYWTSSFESAVKFSQNYISENWSGGGASNLNAFTKNNLQYNYAKDRVQFKNLLELNASIYNAPNDSMRNYRLGDDKFRIYSNFGFRAYSKWYYTIDTEFITQLFTNYAENSDDKQAAFLSPFTVNIGLGIKYELDKKFTQKDRSLTLAVNMAPVSFTYMYSSNKNIDLGRHGFEQDEETGQYEHRLSKLGSTLRADMTVKPNRNVTWKSRFYYFTSYDRVLSEFENSLDLAISRYFSTLIYLHIRYDDSVGDKDKDLSYFQINEILSFGFSYKW